MIRLLIVVAVIATLATLLFRREGEDTKPELLYQQQTRQAEALEEALQNQAREQLESIDEKSR